GSVISQTYNGKEVYTGQQVPINSIMELTIGRRGEGNMVTVPNLRGLTIKEAYDRLNGTGLRPYLSCSQCLTESDSLNFMVIRQTPVAADSSQIPEGSPITIFAASGLDSEE
ncbi:MAG TPA: PASTA domain-containing protein, partial [Brumimicrobium sp.]|nr:PASTA domain-containing protein [Brumimicrobium sp.]